LRAARASLQRLGFNLGQPSKVKQAPRASKEAAGFILAEPELRAVRTGSCEALETPRLTLRCVSEGDAIETSLLMTEQVSRWLANWPFPFSEEMSRQRIRQMQQWTVEGRAIAFAIVRKADGRLIGWATVVREKPGSSRASLSYWLGEAFQGHGYMKEVAPAVIREGFRKLNVNKIEAAAQLENLASIALMRACGMVEQGQTAVFAAARNREEICAVFGIERAQSL
jgi:ribosomal-protein-alanine N-acetyltransferase